jgi:hypothetical protein
MPDTCLIDIGGSRVSHQIQRHLLSSLPAARGAATLRLVAQLQRPPAGSLTGTNAFGQRLGRMRRGF